MNKIFGQVPFLLVALGVTALDLFTKYLVLNSLELGKSVMVLGDFFRLTLVMNRGITFGMFSGSGSENPDFMPIVLMIVSSIALILVVFIYFNLSRYIKEGFPQTIARVAIMFIIGGALGNIFDRMMNQAVVDFIDIGIGNLRWYIFNVADSFVVVGAITMGFLFLFFEKTREIESLNK